MVQQLWVQMAEENFAAAREALDACRCRPSVNRAYFAMYQAATGLFIQVGLEPPARGNWPHKVAPTLFEDLKVRGALDKLGRKSIRFKEALTSALRVRCEADYAPSACVDPKAARDLQRLAGEFLKVIRILVRT